MLEISYRDISHTVSGPTTPPNLTLLSSGPSDLGAHPPHWYKWLCLLPPLWRAPWCCALRIPTHLIQSDASTEKAIGVAPASCRLHSLCRDSKSSGSRDPEYLGELLTSPTVMYKIPQIHSNYVHIGAFFKLSTGTDFSRKGRQFKLSPHFGFTLKGSLEMKSFPVAAGLYRKIVLFAL